MKIRKILSLEFSTLCALALGTLTILLICSSFVFAEDISLELAIIYGFDNNHDLEKKREEIKSLERERGILKTDVDWYLRVNGNYRYDSEKLSLNTGSVTPKGDNASIFLDIGKSTLKGLSISSQLSLNDPKPFKFEDLDEKYNLKIELSQKLYPLTPSETERKLIELDNRLSIAQKELNLLKKNKEIEWIESYFEILHLYKLLELSILDSQFHEKELQRLEAQSMIGELGKEELMMAEIALKEANIQKKQLESTVTQVERLLKLELGLDKELNVKADSSYVKPLAQRLDSVNIELGHEEIEKALKEYNIELKRVLLESKYAKDNLKWQSKEGRLSVDAFGGYQYNSSDIIPDDYKKNWEVGVVVSYDFYDGGRQALIISDIQGQIGLLEKEYEYILEQLKQKFNDMLTQYRIDTINLEAKEIAIDKAKIENKFWEKQYKEGLISEAVYKQQSLAVRKVEIDCIQARDKLMFNKAKIALFLGLL